MTKRINFEFAVFSNSHYIILNNFLELIKKFYQINFNMAYKYYRINFLKLRKKTQVKGEYF